MCLIDTHQSKSWCKFFEWEKEVKSAITADISKKKCVNIINSRIDTLVRKKNVLGLKTVQCMY